MAVGSCCQVPEDRPPGVCEAQPPHGLKGMRPSHPLKTSPLPSLLSPLTCLSPLLDAPPDSRQAQGHQRLKSCTGGRAQARSVPPHWPGRCRCARAHACTHLHTHVHTNTYVRACACSVLSIVGLWVCADIRVLIHLYACPCVHCVFACACAQRKESLDLWARARPLPVATAHWTEPLGEVTGHLGKAEQK